MVQAVMLDLGLRYKMLISFSLHLLNVFLPQEIIKIRNSKIMSRILLVSLN